MIENARISTVVPGKARGEESEDHPLTNMDLAMKLHYIRGVYFFENATRDHDQDYLSLLTMRIEELKKPMFPLLDRFFVTAGRVRRSEPDASAGGGGRPYIKCNDAGVRIVEASRDKTVEEWLKALQECGCDSEDSSCHGGLCYDQVIGPDIGFSPLVYLQFTRFKCGGFSVGLSWAHLLGDVLSASTFIDTWAQIMAGHVPQESTHVLSFEKMQQDSTRLVPKKPMSLRELDQPVGNHWQLTANNCRNMRSHSFWVTPGQLDLLMSNTCGQKASNFSSFEIISSVIWKSLSQIRNTSGSQIVTICCYDNCVKEYDIPNNKGMVFGTIEADARKSDISELTYQIARKKTIENNVIDKMIGHENAMMDYFVYGANLTFVNLEEVEIYELEVKGQKPTFANYTIGGVGEEGMVMILPLGPKHSKKKYANGRTITVVLPEYQLGPLKNELKERWNIS